MSDRSRVRLLLGLLLHPSRLRYLARWAWHDVPIHDAWDRGYERAQRDVRSMLTGGRDA